jgi:hypothetical protein
VRHYYALAATLLGGFLISSPAWIMPLLSPRYPNVAQTYGDLTARLARPTTYFHVAIVFSFTCFLIASYLAWNDERDELVKCHKQLAEYSSPRLHLEFNPSNPGCLYTAFTAAGARALYVRILPKALVPILGCKGFLESIERLDHNSWQSIGFATRPQLHWADLHEQKIAEADIYSDNESQFLDIGYLRQGENSFHLSVDLLQNTIAPLFVQYPRGIFKFVIRVVGKYENHIVEAVLKLQFQQTDEWNNPVVIALSERM